MKKKTIKILKKSCMALAGSGLMACSTPSGSNAVLQEPLGWQQTLEQKLPLLGHRNWVVVTDMAYPLQTNPGILTLYSTDGFEQTVRQVSQMIDKAPHIFAHVYLDEEQKAMSEALCLGWNDYQEKLKTSLKLDEAKYILHEELIHKLDEVSKLCQVVIIKTNLTLPYSSVFFELDCNYWNVENENKLRQSMK